MGKAGRPHVPASSIQALPHRLTLATQVVTRLIVGRHLKPLGLSVAEWRLLTVVGQHHALRATEAAEHAGIDKVKGSRASERLVSLGWMRRATAQDDGRGRRLRLTAKGSRVFACVAPAEQQIEVMLAACLTKGERQTLQRALDKLIAHTQDLLDQENGRSPAPNRVPAVTPRPRSE